MLPLCLLCLCCQSGITPNAETLAQVDELKKNNSKWFFATFKVDGISIVPDSQWGEPALKAQGDAAVAAAFEKQVWPEFTKQLTSADGPRFAVIDFVYTTKDGRIQKTLLSLGWCPDKGTPAKQKMTFASTKTAFETKINIGKKYQANDESDLEFSSVFEHLQKL